MDQNEFHAVATKSVKGAFALISRSFLLQILGLITSFILTIFLDPASFGVFFVVTSVIVFFNYFQDIGLAASLIQKREEPTVSELRTVFLVQEVIVLCLVIPAFIFSHNVTQFYRLNTDGYYLYIALLVSFLLTSLRTIPTIIMERKLEYSRLVIPQIIENTVFNISLVMFAILGFKVQSFTIAILLRSIIGLAATYAIQSWSIGFAFDRKSLKKLISFGIPFQTNSILALFKDDFRTIYLGKILPLNQLGYIGFAEKIANLPLRLVMDNIIKVTFPSFSRLQDDKKALKIAIEKSLFLITLFIFPVAIGIIVYSPVLIEYFPRYQKWQPAILSIVFFSMGSVISSISTPLTNFLNAIGKVKITLYFMVFWTFAIWFLTIPLVNMYGYNGVAASSFLVSITSIAVFLVSKKYVQFKVIGSIYKQFVAAIIMLLFAAVTLRFIDSLFLVFVYGIFSILVYMGAIYLFAKNELNKVIKFIILSVKKT